MSKEMTKQFEGYRDAPYKDTEGKTTIGYGFNLDDPAMKQRLVDAGYTGGKIKSEVAEKAFDNAYSSARFDAAKYLGYDAFNKLDPDRQAILTDMSYNLGLNRLSKFKNLRNAIIDGDYQLASKEMLNSLWAKQVKSRATTLASKMR